jgi:4-hydroxy-3-methylbut-2-enyl diphosphate reductase
LTYSSQTTLSVDDCAEIIDALRERFPEINGPRKDDICYATQNRQDAVSKLANMVDIMFVVGSKNSSNSNRLREKSENIGVPSYLIDNAGDIDPALLEGKLKIGVTAGASAPKVLIDQVVEKLQACGGKLVTEVAGRAENTIFEVPAELRIKQVN